jgi:putative DNA primase/helicase
MKDSVQAFLAAIDAAGLQPGEVIPDGVLRRCGTAAKPRSKNGWYILHNDPIAGAYGDWATGLQKTWSNGSILSEADRQRLQDEIDRQKAAREKERQAGYAKRAEEARAYMAGLPDATGDVKYLAKKGLEPCPGLKADGDTLVVPVLNPDDHLPMSYQTILPGRKPLEKKNLPGGRMAGGYFPIPGSKDAPVCICEGISTGLSIHLATGYTVLCAFSASNLAAVAKMARKQYVSREIIVCADNDGGTDGNPGVRAATAAAEAIGAKLAIPPADGDAVSVDFDDLRRARGIDIIMQTIKEARRLGTEDTGQSADDRPIIRIAPGRLADMATEGEAALIRAGTPIYARGGVLQRPVIEEEDAADGKRVKVARLTTVTSESMLDYLSRACNWQKYDARKKKWNDADPPKMVAQIILSRVGEWQVPSVSGIITCPTMRPDGSVLSQPGYDSQTRLLIVAPPPMPEIPEHPTRKQALEALLLLGDLIAEFPIVDPASYSVALSGLITPVVRGALPAAPMHAITAPTRGTGKSYYTNMVAAIVSGTKCPVIAETKNDEELEKRLISTVITAQPIVSLDNMTRTAQGGLLCQLIDLPLVDVRVLGQSTNVRIENRSTIYCNGNNLTISGDLLRRTIRCHMDAGMEHPELRAFKRKPAGEVAQNRGKYIAAALTVARAYVAAGMPDRLTPLASFDQWSDYVRSALVWLGQTDPVETMISVQDDDPRYSELRAVMDAWGAIARDIEVTAAQLVGLATLPAYDGTPPSDVLREALLAVAGERGVIDVRRLGNYLRANADRVIGHWRIRRGQRSKGGFKWKVVRSE